MREPLLIGVDFTSTPRRRKAIRVARGHFEAADLIRIDALQSCPDWASFEAVLAQPGPWCGGFDFPFGLPRALVETLHWPDDWADLVAHVARLSREEFRAALDGVRVTRPVGRRYLHRACDLPAASHSPMKLVNPPVGLMFHEGAPRLLAAGLSVPGMHAGEPARIALEAYPALLARALVGRQSYKSDSPARQTAARRALRAEMLARLGEGAHPLALRVAFDTPLATQALEDASGDTLDAVLALVQAAWCWQRRDAGFGLSTRFDALEGWIATCPG